MKIPVNTKIVQRFPIKSEALWDDSLYIDTDSNGKMNMNGLTTAEPLLSTDTVEELSNQRDENPKGLVLPANCEFDMDFESREQESEGSEDYQYQHQGSLSDLAKKLAPSDSKDTASWAINLDVPGKPGEMEFIVLA